MEIKVLGSWDEDMLWCPSQCFLNIEHAGVNYTVYLRWRHDDPWTCSLYGERTGDLFDRFGKFWRDSDDLKLIEASALECVQAHFDSLG